MAEIYEPIDVKALAAKVNPKLPRLIPGFVFNRIEKLLHVKEINDFLEPHVNDDGQTFLESLAKRLNVKMVLQGAGAKQIEEMAGQSVMFACNHPYGGPEAMILFSYIHKLYPNSKLLTQSFLKFIKSLQKICVFNKGDIKTLKQAVDDRIPLLFFPAGFCSRALSFGDVFDYEWKSSFVKIARKNNMPIFVMFADGQMSDRTLKWTNLRKLLGIKTSVESIFLPDEMLLMDGKTVTYTVGSVINVSDFPEDVSDAEMANRLRQYCYTLKTNSSAVFNPNLPAVLPLE